MTEQFYNKHKNNIATTKDISIKDTSIGAIPVNDRIADNMFQQLVLFPHEYDVIIAPNLNGDYISDLAAACVGGLGIAPGANIGDHRAIFEATHGTAPDITGKDRANPCSLISGNGSRGRA